MPRLDVLCNDRRVSIPPASCTRLVELNQYLDGQVPRDSVLTGMKDPFTLCFVLCI